MIIGAILAIIEGIIVILKCILDFPPEVTSIYAVNLGVAIFSTIVGIVMIVVGITTLRETIRKPKKATKQVNK